MEVVRGLEPAEVAVTLILLLLLALPIERHLRMGWAIRRFEILGEMSERGVRLYFRQFYPAVVLPDTSLTKLFDGQYHERYGRRHFFVPTILLLLVAGVLLLLATRMALGWLSETTRPGGLPPIAAAAVAGAYMWVALDLISRSRRRELASGDLFSSTVRLVIAIPLGYAFAGILKDEAGPLVAFALGAFPTGTLVTAIRRFADRRLGLSEKGTDARSELEQLQGVTPGIAERFGDESISTILQLAYADPVDLTIRTNFAFAFVVDCVSQALAWIYLEDKLPTMRASSLRGAYEIYTLIRDLDGDEPETRAAARATIEIVSAIVDLHPVVMEQILRQIGEDPYTEFNYAIWNVADDD